MSDTQPDFMSTREAAKLLGLSLTTVQLWVEAGILPAWKTAGGHRRIPRNAVEQFRAKQRASILGETAEHPVVLVVDDDPFVLTLYRQHFIDWSFPLRLITAEDGFNGLIEIGRTNPVLIITDLDMPGMDGFEMIRRISLRQDQSIRSIVVVTGLKPSQIEKKGGVPVGIPVLSKPIPFQTLSTLVDNALKAQATETVGSTIAKPSE
jgi:excisionase family DNA binding protein